MSYFRRSRNGCHCCKRSRVKCDERRPACTQCREKGISCEGYTQQLKWVAKTNPIPRGSERQHIKAPNRKTLEEPNLVVITSQGREQCNASISLSQLNLDPYGIYITNPRDRILIEYNLSTLPQLVFLNSSRSFSIAALQFFQAMHSNNVILYSSALASAASHLLARGAITKLEFYEKRQNVLASLRSALIAPDERPLISLGSGNQAASIPRRCQNSTIDTSLGLAAIELMQGANVSSFRGFLQGTTTLVVERHQYADGLGPGNRCFAELDSSQFILTKRMLAYFDIFSCLPCARPPILHERYWLRDEACVAEENTDGSGLDPVMGCFPAVIGLIGRSAALVSAVFGEDIKMSQYLVDRDELLRSLAEWKPLERLPPIDSTSASSHDLMDEEYNICLSAGKAHSLATQIYLHRTTNFDQHSEELQKLTGTLRDSILEVGVSSASATVMLWPFWVLGCESYDTTFRDEVVAPMFTALASRQGFLNISQCFKTLQERIWVLRPVPVPVHKPAQEYIKLEDFDGLDQDDTGWYQSQWARYCWKEMLEVILA